MIAMEYTIDLPASHDMTTIRQRIADKGALLDGFPDLAFKAYLYAERGKRADGRGGNGYAPFYLWHRTEGIDAFLCGPGFAGLSADFGRPTVTTWTAVTTQRSDDLRRAVWATREAEPITPRCSLAAWREQEQCRAVADLDAGALATIGGFDPQRWCAHRLRLWARVPTRPHAQLYAVGYVALGAG